jgi:hypothetical protein
MNDAIKNVDGIHSVAELRERMYTDPLVKQDCMFPDMPQNPLHPNVQQQQNFDLSSKQIRVVKQCPTSPPPPPPNRPRCTSPHPFSSQQFCIVTPSKRQRASFPTQIRRHRFLNGTSSEDEYTSIHHFNVQPPPLQYHRHLHLNKNPNSTEHFKTNEYNVLQQRRQYQYSIHPSRRARPVARRLFGHSGPLVPQPSGAFFSFALSDTPTQNKVEPEEDGNVNGKREWVSCHAAKTEECIQSSNEAMQFANSQNSSSAEQALDAHLKRLCLKDTDNDEDSLVQWK